MSARIVFMGTPPFAVPALKKLYQVYQIVGVVTQPDRKSGRGRKVMASAVKQVAEEANLPIFQPATLKDPQAVQAIANLEPELIVVAAFGQILPSNILNMPPLGCINIHASLLPRWRGAAPVAAAIRAGDDETGITLMLMDEGLDTGPIISAQNIPIKAEHTRLSLTEELSILGADLLMHTLPDWIERNIVPQAQDNDKASLAPRIKKEEGLINWHQTAAEIERHIRAFYPWPGTFTRWRERPVKILSASENRAWSGNLPHGTVFDYRSEVAVATAKGALVLNQIQPAGKRAMAAADFARGANGFMNAQLK